MYTEYSRERRVFGFGETAQEAKDELIFNIARQDLRNDASGKYQRRREELYTWLPLPSILSIRNVTAITYDGAFLTNNKTGDQILIKHKRMSHYLYLYNLIGSEVSFEDFTIAMGREVDEFLANISPEFGKLDEFPYTKPGEMRDAISVTNYPHKCFVCETKQGNEVLVCDGNKVLSIMVPDGVERECIIAYGFAKLNVLYDGLEVKLCRKDQRGSTK